MSTVNPATPLIALDAPRCRCLAEVFPCSDQV
jgi:hypothetical protein